MIKELIGRRMAVSKRLTVRLSTEDFNHLQSEGSRRGISPSSLVGHFVRLALGQDGIPDDPAALGLEALERLASLTRDLPPIDAAAIARQSRDDLELRSTI